MTGRVVASILLFVCILWFYFEVDAAREFVRLHAPQPEKVIRVGKVPMRQIDALCHELIPRMSPPASRVRVALSCRHYKRLVPVIFVLASLTGWCASIWLLALQRRAELTSEKIVSSIASLLLAAIVGIICYLSLIAPFSWFSGNTDGLETAAVFPLLGGLFMRQFFDRLPDLLSAIFDILTGKKGGKGDSRTNGKKKSGVSTALLVLVGVAAATRADGQISYFRCADPSDKCIAFSEEQQADCPECKKWTKAFLELSDVLKSAQLEQRESGTGTSGVASNFFLDAASEKLYGFDLAEAGERRAVTREIYKNPEKFGLYELAATDRRAGSLALIGDIAGIVTPVKGRLKIAYPSAATGEIRFIDAAILEWAEKTKIKYVAPTNRKE